MSSLSCLDSGRETLICYARVMQKRPFYFIVLFVVILLSSVFGLSKKETEQVLSAVDGLSKQDSTNVDEVGDYVVTKVIDGDTIQIDRKFTLRYIGIDTPETVDPRRTQQCFGKEATEENKRLVLGKRVTLEKDVSETDRYGRLLRYVYVEGEMINNLLVENGFAQARSYPPDIKHQEKLRLSEEMAREKGKGLWASCVSS